MCFPAYEADLGWKEVMPGFTDACFPSQYITLRNPNVQPAQWKQFEGSGIAVPTSTGPSVPGRWKGLYPNAAPLGVLSCTINFLTTTIGGNPATQIQAEIIWVPSLGPTFSEIHVFDRINVSKKSPFFSDSCTPVIPATCTMSGRMVFEWWPSCNGVGKAGPQYP